MKTSKKENMLSGRTTNRAVSNSLKQAMMADISRVVDATPAVPAKP